MTKLAIPAIRATTQNAAPDSAKWTMNTHAAQPTVTTNTDTQRSTVLRPTFWLMMPKRIMPLAVVRLETISNQLTSVGLWCRTVMSSTGRKDTVIWEANHMPVMRTTTCVSRSRSSPVSSWMSGVRFPLRDDASSSVSISGTSLWK